MSDQMPPPVPKPLPPASAVLFAIVLSMIVVSVKVLLLNTPPPTPKMVAEAALSVISERMIVTFPCSVFAIPPPLPCSEVLPLIRLSLIVMSSGGNELPMNDPYITRLSSRFSRDRIGSH